MIRTDVALIRSEESSTGTFYKWEDGILTYRLVPNLKRTTDEALAIDYKIILDLQAGQKSPFLGDLRELINMEPHARRYISQRMPTFTNRAAALIGSPLSRILINTFQILNRPSVTTKAFNDPHKAIIWLKQ